MIYNNIITFIIFLYQNSILSFISIGTIIVPCEFLLLILFGNFIFEFKDYFLRLICKNNMNFTIKISIFDLPIFKSVNFPLILKMMLVYFLLNIIINIVLVWKYHLQISIAKLNKLVSIRKVIFFRRIKKYCFNYSICVCNNCSVVSLHWITFCFSFQVDFLQELLVSFIVCEHKVFLSYVESLKFRFFD